MHMDSINSYNGILCPSNMRNDLASQLAYERWYFGTDSVSERAKDARVVRYFAVRKRIEMVMKIVKLSYPRCCCSRERSKKLSKLRRAREANHDALGPALMKERAQDRLRKGYIMVTFMLTSMPRELFSADTRTRDDWLRPRAALLLRRARLQNQVPLTQEEVATLSQIG